MGPSKEEGMPGQSKWFVSNIVQQRLERMSTIPPALTILKSVAMTVDLCVCGCDETIRCLQLWLFVLNKFGLQLMLKDKALDESSMCASCQAGKE